MIFKKGALAFFLPIILVIAGCAPVRTTKEPTLLESAVIAREEGIRAYDGEDYEGALYKFKEALVLDRSMENLEGEITDLVNMGRALVYLGRHDESLSFLNGALKLSFELKDEARLSSTYAALAMTHFHMRNYDAALKDIDESISIDRRLGRFEGRALNLMALIYIESGRLTEASRVLDAALGENKKAGDPAATADTYRALARLMARKNMVEEGIIYFNKAYALDKTHGSFRKMARDLRGMAGLHIRRGRYNDAVVLLKRSYAVHMHGGFAGAASVDIDRLIGVYEKMGDREKVVYYTTLKKGIMADIEK